MRTSRIWYPANVSTQYSTQPRSWLDSPRAIVTLITGTGRGIGKAIVLLFARENSNIAISDIDLTTTEKTAEEIWQIGRRAIAIKADVSKPADVDSIVSRTINELGGVHILVNNAGILDECARRLNLLLNIGEKLLELH